MNNNDCTIVWIARIEREGCPDAYTTAFTSRNKAIEHCVEDVKAVHEGDCNGDDAVLFARHDLDDVEFFMDRKTEYPATYTIEGVKLM